MKLLTKIGLISLLGGTCATALYAAPDVLSSDGSVEVDQTNKLHVAIMDDSRFVLHLQQVARREKDVIKLNCVNDKLVQIRPLFNIADQAQADVKSGREVKASLQSMTESTDAIHKLRDAAERCVGEELGRGESSNSYTHPDIPDPTADDPWGETFEPPLYPSSAT